MSDEYYKTKRQEALGSISGWDVITTAEPDVSTHIPSNDSEYTLPDLYLQLKNLMNRIDPDQIEYLIRSIRTHIADKENPHYVTLDKMNTNVVKELYKLWQQQGHTSDGDTEDQFLKQLFQYVQIANVQETLEGKSLDKVPSVYSVEKTIEKHNADIDAHANLFAAVFPGEPLIGPPSYAVLGLVSQARIPENIEVSRNSVIYINNRFGELEEVPVNTIKPDWSYGEPALPIFDKYRQLVTSTEDFNHSSYVANNITIDTSKMVVYSPRVKNAYTQYMCESSDTSAKEHSLLWTCPNSLSSGDDSNNTADVTYTYSIYVYPINRDAFTIDISNCFTSNNQYNYVSFKFSDKLTFINAGADKDKLEAGITQLASGWYRIWVTFTTDKELKNSKIKLLLNDIYDGDFTYKGNGLSGAYLFGAQLTNTPTVAPYSPTSTLIDKTVIKVPVEEEWFNTNASTIIAEVSNSSLPQKGKKTDNIISVVGKHNDTNVLSAEIRYSQAYANPYFCVRNNASTIMVEMHSSNEYINDSDRAMVSLAYDTTGINYSTTGMEEPDTKEYKLPSIVLNQDITYIYLGSDMNGSNQLNGYMFGFIYYPFKCTIENLKYFLEDPIYAVRR